MQSQHGLRPRKMACFIGIPAALVCMALPAIAASRCDNPADFDDWFGCRVKQLRDNSKANLKDNLKQIATEKQATAPSGSAASTSLLDRTSGPDLVSAAVGLAGFGKGSANSGGTATGSSGDFNVTSSAYSLYTMASGQHPLSPDVYDRGINWRRFFVSVGSETPQDAMEKNNGKNRIVGAKFLLINHRDVSTAGNEKLVNGLDTGDPAVILTNVAEGVRKYIQTFLPAEDNMFDDNWNKKTLVQLTPANVDHVDEMIRTSGLIDSMQILSDRVKSVVRQIRTAPQLSIAYMAKIAEQRKQGMDTQRLEAVFDYGFTEWIGVTLNGSFDYLNSPMIGANIRQERAAGELHFTPNHTQALKQGSSPFLFGLSGESKWMNTYDSIYKVQLRAEIPIAKGISLPISVTHVNRADLIKKSDQETVGQFGFTVDVAKLTGLFSQSKP